jgi:anti-sigma-K factor RskA
MTDHADLFELAELYPLGGLSPEERLRLAVHVADGCAECEPVLRAHTRIADDLLLAVSPVQPSASVRAELMERVKSETRAIAAPQRMAPPPLPLRRVRSSRAFIATAAGLVLAVGLAGVLGLRLAGERTKRGEAEQALAGVQAQLALLDRDMKVARSERLELEEQMEKMARITNVMGAPVLTTLALAGQGPFSKAVAVAYIDQNGRVTLYAYHLPPVPDGRVYQMWVIGEKQAPLSVGLLTVDPQGESKYDSGPIRGLEGSVKVAVTLEPAGGVPAPTGPFVLLGES